MASNSKDPSEGLGSSQMNAGQSRPPNPTDFDWEAVTPGLDRRTYAARQSSLDNVANSGPLHSYFSRADTTIPQARRGENSQGAKAGTATAATPVMDPQDSQSDLRAANPDLSLSGRIISATFNAPNAFTYHHGGQWELRSRHGQSALFDSFAYLSSSATPWDHTVVAWTGEIDMPPEEPISPPETPPATTINASSTNPLSAPVPVDATPARHSSPPSDGLRLSKEDQVRLEDRLYSDKAIRTVPVWLFDDSEITDDGLHVKDQSRWRKYAEHELYTLFHYKQQDLSDARKERVQWANYYRMNQAFAERVIEIYKPGDIVIVHDYNLMLLPSMLRQRVPGIYISFFLHCPFPSSEFLRCLPRRKEILQGILGSNLIGFQSYSYSRHFLSCCTRILGYPSDTLGVDAYGSRVQVGVFPIGIDVAKTRACAWSSSVNDKVKALKTMYSGKKIIVGRDRLDSVRGVSQKLQAFERFLELHPEWREKVVLIQVTTPTQVTVDKEDPENKFGSRVNELVMQINGQYGSLGFSPVQHYPQYLEPDEYFALLRAGDIGLITSVRDGMNTTSLEYIVCQKEGHGPLIISEFSGTAGSLGDAIHINPWDTTGVANKIHTALTMSDDRRMAMQGSLYNHVTNNNVQSWITKFIRKTCTVLGDANSAIATPLLDRTLMLSAYRAAGKRLFMFDYDGTLTPIVSEPSAAIPSKRVIQALQQLTADPKNLVWIISGRDQEFLKEHLGHIQSLGFSAEHGSFMKPPGADVWENLAEKIDMRWQEEAIDIFQRYTNKVHGSFIERKRCAVTWHYRLADPELGQAMAEECLKKLVDGIGRKWEVEVMPGKANVEVRPTAVNKGEIAKSLVQKHHNPIPLSGKENDAGAIEFVLCMGDDFTDEDMFRSLNGVSGSVLDPNHVFTVTVGARTKVTLARWHLLEPEDVVDSVALLTGLDEGVALSQNNLAAVSAVEGHVPNV